MILNKIANNLKRRDWGAALLEIVIVVIGIFIGLQVDDWNTARKERMEEKEVLSRLLAESEVALSFIRAQSEQFEGQIESLESLVAFLYSNESLPEDTSNFYRGYETALYYPQLKPVKSVYDEISNSGSISLIQDEQVRLALSSYHASLEAFDSQLSYFRQFTNQGSSNPSNYSVGIVDYLYAPSSFSRRTTSIDFNKMRAKSELANALLASLRHQRNFNSNRRDVLKKVENLCTTIAEAIQTNTSSCFGQSQ